MTQSFCCRKNQWSSNGHKTRVCRHARKTGISISIDFLKLSSGNIYLDLVSNCQPSYFCRWRRIHFIKKYSHYRECGYYRCGHCFWACEKDSDLYFYRIVVSKSTTTMSTKRTRRWLFDSFLRQRWAGVMWLLWLTTDRTLAAEHANGAGGVVRFGWACKLV